MTIGHYMILASQAETYSLARRIATRLHLNGVTADVFAEFAGELGRPITNETYTHLCDLDAGRTPLTPELELLARQL